MASDNFASKEVDVGAVLFFLPPAVKFGVALSLDDKDVSGSLEKINLIIKLNMPENVETYLDEDNNLIMGWTRDTLKDLLVIVYENRKELGLDNS